MARGDVREAASLLEVAAQRGRDASTLLRLATVRRSLKDLPGAVKAATAAVELAPRNFLMCLLLGSLREAVGAIHAAERAYRAACDVAPADMPFQPAMMEQLKWARRRVDAANRWRERLFSWEPARARLELRPEEERRIRGFRTNILENLDGGPVVPPAFLIPGVKPAKYFEPSSFAAVAKLERATDEIRSEFIALSKARSSDLESRLTGLDRPVESTGEAGRWSMIPLIRNGKPVDKFARHCPRTMELAEELDFPRLALISPSLYFSVLEPGTRIAPHTGITNARVIAHLPLIVPDDCGFKVGGEVRKWEVGKALVFDDMTVHEAWNDSDRIRVVLIADFWRPELTSSERSAVEELMACEDIGERA